MALVRLGPGDLPAVRRLLDRDPVKNVFVDYRVTTTGLDPRRLGGEMLGYVDGGRLLSAFHTGANLVPVAATAASLDAFVDYAASRPRRCASILGPEEAVMPLWAGLRARWGPARSERPGQPFMELRRPSPLPPDPAVRRVTLDELDALYPASVAMFTEEVGVSPEVDGPQRYRARVAELITRGWAFARIEDGRVIFKAEVGVATRHACQVQGVYVDPEHRQRGLAAPGMAAVARIALREIAPVVSLYVNADNVAARRAYEHAGFVTTGTFATILF